MKKFLAMTLVASISLGIVGCSSGSSSSSSSSGEGSDVITIGMSAPITGNNAEYGKTFSVAAEIALERINEAGGINGKKVEMITMDSKGDPKEASEIAKKFSQNKDVLAVVGDFTSSSCMAAAPIYGENGLILLTPSASHPDLAAMNEYIFGVAGRQDGEAPFLAEYQAQKYLGSKNSAVVYVNNDWGVTVKDLFVARAEECGLNIVAVEQFMEGEKDYNALLTKIRQSNPDTINVISQAADAALLCKQIRQLGWNDVNISISGGAFSPQLIQLGGEELNGAYIDAPFYLDESNPEVVEFMEEFEKRAGYPTTTHAPYTYDAMMILFEAIKRADDAGSLDRKTVRDELAATKDYPGYAGNITFTEAGDVHKQYVIFEIKDCEFVRVTDYDFGLK